MPSLPFALQMTRAVSAFESPSRIATRRQTLSTLSSVVVQAPRSQIRQNTSITQRVSRRPQGPPSTWPISKERRTEQCNHRPRQSFSCRVTAMPTQGEAQSPPYLCTVNQVAQLVRRQRIHETVPFLQLVHLMVGSQRRMRTSLDHRPRRQRNSSLFLDLPVFREWHHHPRPRQRTNVACRQRSSLLELLQWRSGKDREQMSHLLLRVLLTQWLLPLPLVRRHLD